MLLFSDYLQLLFERLPSLESKLQQIWPQWISWRVVLIQLLHSPGLGELGQYVLKYFSRGQFDKVHSWKSYIAFPQGITTCSRRCVESAVKINTQKQAFPSTNPRMKLEGPAIRHTLPQVVNPKEWWEKSLDGTIKKTVRRDMETLGNILYS